MEYGLDPSGDVIMRSKSQLKSLSTDTDMDIDEQYLDFRDMYKKCCGKECKYPIMSGFKCVKLLGTFCSTFLFSNGVDKLAVKIINKHFNDEESDVLSKLKDNCSKKRILCYNNKFFIGNNMFLITEYISRKTLDEYYINSV